MSSFPKSRMFQARNPRTPLPRPNCMCQLGMRFAPKRRQTPRNCQRQQARKTSSLRMSQRCQASQSVQAEAADPDSLPGSHDTSSDAPDEPTKDPALLRVQLVAPESGAKLPGEQSVHSVLPATSGNLARGTLLTFASSSRACRFSSWAAGARRASGCRKSSDRTVVARSRSSRTVRAGGASDLFRGTV